MIAALADTSVLADLVDEGGNTTIEAVEERIPHAGVSSFILLRFSLTRGSCLRQKQGRRRDERVPW